MFHCLTSDTDPSCGPRRLLCHRGKTCNLQEEKPCSCWGRKNPMSHLSRMKNPDLPCPSVAAALRAYSYILSSLDVSISLGTTASFSSLSKARVHYVLARPYQLITMSCCFLYLVHLLYVISYINHCHIRHASPP